LDKKTKIITRETKLIRKKEKSLKIRSKKGLETRTNKNKVYKRS
jgi:hypothetical protein